MKERPITIAITGPDGSGKTTLCELLSSKLKPSLIIHAVKDRNHFLKSTSFALKCWRLLKKFGYYGSTFGRFIVFYPFEYLENIRRFTFKPKQYRYIIYDRHPIDRIMMKHELLANYHSGIINKKRFFIEYPLLLLWGWIYERFFPRVDKMFVLLPDAGLCLMRANGQYKNLKAAENRICAYKAAIDTISKNNHVYPIHIDRNMSIEDIGILIIKEIDSGS